MHHIVFLSLVLTSYSKSLEKTDMIVYNMTNLHTITTTVIMITNKRITMNMTPTPAPITADKLPGFVCCIRKMKQSNTTVVPGDRLIKGSLMFTHVLLLVEETSGI